MNLDAINSLEKKMKATEVELDKVSALDRASPEYMVIYSSLIKRLDDLRNAKKELDESITRERIQLVLRGENVGYGRVSARILSSVVGGVQNIADSIANALGHEPTSKGRIPSYILREADLAITGFFPGSFGIELEGAIDSNDSLFDEPLISRTLSKFYSLISSTDSDQLLDCVAELGSRTLLHYRNWINTIRDSGLTIECKWESRYMEHFNWTIDDRSLPPLIEMLDVIEEEDYSKEVLIGKFTGLNIRRETFEFVLSNSGEVISGRGHLDKLRHIGSVIGDEVQTIFIKTTARNTSTGREKTTWLLLGDDELTPLPTSSEYTDIGVENKGKTERNL